MNINDAELQKFMELAGEVGVKVFLLHGDNWMEGVANLAALPASGNTTGDIRQTLDTGILYRWNGSAWVEWALNHAFKSMTQGSIPFIGASSVLSQDNANLFWDDTNNRLGIGTATPEGLLHSLGSTSAALGIFSANASFPLVVRAQGNAGVTGNTAAYRIGLEFGVGGTQNGYIDFIRGTSSNNGYLRFGTSSADRMTIDAVGSIGIGTTTPSEKLHVTSATASLARIRISETVDSADSHLSGLLLYESTTFRGGIMKLGLTHNITLWTTTVALTIQASDNNIGINETAPDYKLDVNGTFGFTPGASVTPVDNGDVVFEATSNTSFTVKHKGSDGTVRSISLVLV